MMLQPVALLCDESSKADAELGLAWFDKRQADKLRLF